MSSQEFAERILSEINSCLSVNSMYVGYKLGLFKALAKESKPISSTDFAKKVGCHPRYIREWLECMATGRYIQVFKQEDSYLFQISPEHASVLADEDSPFYSAPLLCWSPATTEPLPHLVKAFKTGEKVPFEKFGEDCFREAIGNGNKPLFKHFLVKDWLQTLPDIVEQLKQGGKILDVGCGCGHSSLSYAKGFPNVIVDAVDIDEDSIQEAKNLLAKEDPSIQSRVHFHCKNLNEMKTEGELYTLVSAFECIHDMTDPVSVLKKMKSLVKKGGAVFIADEKVEETIEENTNLIGNLMYNFSVLHCLPQAMEPESRQTGTVCKPSIMKQYAQEAGFSNVEILPIQLDIWRFYRFYQ